MKKVLVTGAAGFIGSHLCKRLLDEGKQVVGVDNLNDYYDVQLKRDRLSMLIGEHPNFDFRMMDFSKNSAVASLFDEYGFQEIVHLGAQAGVRYSLINPHAYIDSNVKGTLNILESCRHNSIEHLLFASSSSVYGANTVMPFSVHQNVDHPMSLYAASKKSCELMAHTYSQLYNIPITGLRFFTVYGPWGRPDMAIYLFTQKILAGKSIQIFNNGNMSRDFTYIDDIIEGVTRLLSRPAQPNLEWNSSSPDPGSSFAPFRVHNIGNHKAEKLLDFIEILEKELGITAKREYLPMQAGDVPETYADVESMYKEVGFVPSTNIETGIKRFVEWYLSYQNAS